MSEVKYPTDPFCNCLECGGGPEGSIEHDYSCSYNKVELVVHCKKSPFDVYIGRPTKWGNPFVIGKIGDGTTGIRARLEVVELYRTWIMQNKQAKLRQAAKVELRGKILGCWCAPLACHGDVLAAIANDEHQ